jgi:hypothetical protein
MTMNNELLKILAQELATKVNSIVNIPFLTEEDEEIFFQLVILNVLQIVMSKFSKDSVN